jgi:hypothetical protein
VEDRVSGGFARLALRWRLAPGEWRETPDGAEGPMARLRLAADAPLACALEAGWESPTYGAVRAAPVLVARAAAPVLRLLTRVELPRRAA